MDNSFCFSLAARTLQPWWFPYPAAAGTGTDASTAHHHLPMNGWGSPTWSTRLEGQEVGCLDVPGRKLGSMVRINGLFHLLINGLYIGVNLTHLPIIDPNFQRDIQVAMDSGSLILYLFGIRAFQVQLIHNDWYVT